MALKDKRAEYEDIVVKAVIWKKITYLDLIDIE